MLSIALSQCTAQTLDTDYIVSLLLFMKYQLLAGGNLEFFSEILAARQAFRAYSLPFRIKKPAWALG